MAFGPNDFHFENGVQKPGLGEYEPTDKARVAAERAAADARQVEEALERAKADIRQEANAIEARQAELEKREADLAAREAEMESREDAATAPATKGRKVASER